MEIITSANTIHAEYRQIILKRIVFIVVLAGTALLLVVVGCTVGPMKFTFGEIVKALANGLFSATFDLPRETVTVVTKIRLPRMVLALLSGFGLAVAGMQLQVILRNPLASPLTLGVQSGAAFGAGLAIITGFTVLGGRYMLMANAFVFALLPSTVIFLLSRMGASGYGVLILAGIAMHFIFNSFLTLLYYISNSDELKSLSLWMMGNLGRATWGDIGLLMVVLVVTVPILFFQNQKLNVLNAGDESAEGIGVNVERTRIMVLIVTAMVSASIICFTGIIGFVGLVAPHIVRMLIGSDARYLMPASGLFGAVFLLGADIMSLKVIEPAVLPVGIITSFAGGPLLLYLIIRKQRERVW
jgi:iron complex transport system permease protein